MLTRRTILLPLFFVFQQLNGQSYLGGGLISNATMLGNSNLTFSYSIGTTYRHIFRTSKGIQTSFNYSRKAGKRGGLLVEANTFDIPIHFLYTLKKTTFNFEISTGLYAAYTTSVVVGIQRLGVMQKYLRYNESDQSNLHFGASLNLGTSINTSKHNKICLFLHISQGLSPVVSIQEKERTFGLGIVYLGSIASAKKQHK